MEVYIFMASNIKGQLQSAMGSINTGVGVMAGMKQMATKQAEAEQAKLEQEETKSIDEYRSYSALGMNNKLPVTPDTVTKLTNASIDLRNNERMKDMEFEGSKGDMNVSEYADELSDMATLYQRRLTDVSEKAKVEALASMMSKRQLRKYGFGGRR